MVQKSLHPFLDKQRHVASLLYFRHHHGKMVRIQSRQQVGVPRLTRQPLRDLPQEIVSCRLPEAVVDVLEPLQIEQEYGKLVPTADSAAYVLRPPIEKQSAIREAGQHIVVGEILEPPLLVDVIDRERDVAGQFGQQLQLLRVKDTSLRR